MIALVVCTFVCVVVAWKLLLRDFLFKAWIFEFKLRQQGISGPPRSLMSGNIGHMMKMRDESESHQIPCITHDIVEYVHPHFVQWEKIYGYPFRVWWGSEPGIFITDLDAIKEVLYNRSGVFWSPSWLQSLRTDFLGRGLVVVNGEEWALRRRIMNPAFHQDKIKGMVGSMVECVSEMLEKWDTKIEAESVEVEACEELTILTADIISKTAFGSSYQKGQRVFELLQHLGKLVLQKLSNPWILSLLVNRKIKEAQRELDSTLEDIIQARIELAGTTRDYGRDLLGLMLDQLDNLTKQGLKEECKTFYVAGHETTAKLLTWTMMLLGTHRPWQERARAEAMEVCKAGVPHPDCLSKLKVVGMVINESLRLYPLATSSVRTAYKTVKVGNITIPEGVGVIIPTLHILHDPKLWGSDANEFNPQRFAEGVTNACGDPFAFMPFSQGQRVCIGQSFALTESKVALAMILCKFSWELSSNYKHSPVNRLALTPKYGLPLIIKRL